MVLATYDEAAAEYARNAGSERPDCDWILTPFDVWMPNPHFRGVRGPHPECDDDYDDGLYGPWRPASQLTSDDIPW